MSTARFIIASLMASLATLVLPLLLASSEIYVEQGVVPHDQVNDGVIRSAGLFVIYGAPVCYLLGMAYYAAAGHVLVRTKRFSLRSWLLLAAAAPQALVVLAAFGLAQHNRNIADGLALVGLLGVFSSVFASVGAAVWWAIAIPRDQSPDPSLQRTAFSSR